MSGNIFLAREGQVVHLMINNLASTTAGNVNVLRLPTGFVPTTVTGANWRNGSVLSDAGDVVRQLSFFNGYMRVLQMPTGKQLGGYATWLVPADWPTTLPGVSA
ncbi:hypothetical protein ACFSDA_15330 [Brachybacterium rhamnosum]|uniref:Uncharacterized protein n=1 Tax=Brachybacterium rhamnosum TaxID=173361 RepID=A0ABW4Q3Z0_9MICO